MFYCPFQQSSIPLSSSDYNTTSTASSSIVILASIGYNITLPNSFAAYSIKPLLPYIYGAGMYHSCSEPEPKHVFRTFRSRGTPPRERSSTRQPSHSMAHEKKNCCSNDQAAALGQPVSSVVVIQYVFNFFFAGSTWFTVVQLKKNHWKNNTFLIFYQFWTWQMLWNMFYV